MSKEDDEILAGLTPEERAAIEAPDEEDTTATQGELEAKAAAAAGATNDEGKDADDKKADDKGDAGGAAAAADDGAAAAAKADEAQPAGAAADEPGKPAGAPVQQAPILVSQAPADAEAKLADIKGKKDAVLAKFDDGDITAKEMQAELDTLNKQERDIEFDLREAKLAEKIEAQRQKNQWDADCASFLSGHEEYKDADLMAHLNETVIAFARMPRNASLTGPQLLDKAHKAVMAERGTPVADAKPDPKPAAKAAKPTLPPDIGGLPAATANDPAEGKWASLDKLSTSNPEAYEAALAKMSESDRDAYLAS